MTRWIVRGLGPRPLLAVLVLAGAALAGCGRKEAAPSEPAAEQPAAEKPAEPVPGKDAPTAAAPAEAKEKAARDALHQPFDEAVRGGEDPPANSAPPASETDNQRSAFKVMREVKSKWGSIRFTSPAGKKVQYTATLKTESGTVRIELRPDLAPNHVRNFVALAEAGYYNGLAFESTSTEELRDDQGNVLGTLRAVEGGSPCYRTDPLRTSIGYWLRPEFSPPEVARHTAGTVGACRVTEPDSAACRFYVIVEGPPPNLDGNFTIFGKVVQGLDVIRTIYSGGVIIDESAPTHGPKPLARPVVIRKVTIERHER
jgi:cyclophilin family peptidyl-prolyl cis-trans isomerase